MVMEYSINVILTLEVVEVDLLLLVLTVLKHLIRQELLVQVMVEMEQMFLHLFQVLFLIQEYMQVVVEVELFHLVRLMEQ